MNAQVHTAASGEKNNHSFLITHLVFDKYESNLQAEHKYTQQQVEKRAMDILNLVLEC